MFPPGRSPHSPRHFAASSATPRHPGALAGLLVVVASHRATRPPWHLKPLHGEPSALGQHTQSSSNKMPFFGRNYRDGWFKKKRLNNYSFIFILHFIMLKISPIWKYNHFRSWIHIESEQKSMLSVHPVFMSSPFIEGTAIEAMHSQQKLSQSSNMINLKPHWNGMKWLYYAILSVTFLFISNSTTQSTPLVIEGHWGNDPLRRGKKTIG